MKSGYHVQHQMDKNVEHDNQVNLPPSTLLRNILATKIWKLSIPPKIRIFWWKILHNGLPVVENLSIREINKLRLSAMWRKNRKSCHLFFQLQVWREIWSLAGVNLHIYPSDNIFNIIQELLELNVKDQLENLPLFIGWRIWKMRNKLLFSKEGTLHIQGSSTVSPTNSP